MSNAEEKAIFKQHQVQIDESLDQLTKFIGTIPCVVEKREQMEQLAHRVEVNTDILLGF
jgi:3-deoxy-D-arabino-heptulosonate 7-phosphate (DAHP) synthase